MRVGGKLPLFFQVYNYLTDQYVKAFVQNDQGNPISGSPVNLASTDSSGLYKNTTLLMPSGTDWVLVKYAVYTDNTYTVLSDSQGGESETIFADPPSSGGGSQVVQSVIGVVTDDPGESVIGVVSC